MPYQRNLSATWKRGLTWHTKADKLLLERAIMNVISNALDHSPPQGTIYVTVQKTDCFLHISITDEGGGFTPEALHHAQEQFFMGDKSRTSNGTSVWDFISQAALSSNMAGSLF